MDCEVDGFGSNETAEELGLVVGPLEGKLPWFGVDTDQGPYEKSLISEAAVAVVERALQVIPDGGVRVLEAATEEGSCDRPARFYLL
jgi:hypothetical protein